MTIKTRINTIRATLAASLGALQTTIGDALSAGAESTAYGLDCIVELGQRAKLIGGEVIGLTFGLVGIAIFYPIAFVRATYQFGEDYVKAANGNPIKALRDLGTDFSRTVKLAVTVDRDSLP